MNRPLSGALTFTAAHVMLKKIDAYPVGRAVLCRWDFLSRRAMRPPEEGSV
ncbi:hypothetical protein HMPREF1545_00995 [Oscillibacter sp. KLE 1728]|nr:hypothetical protein HMPREF1545_00995 [Oscillibacter sp. KLE 1728]ERK66704.1 hypothetical protein HMPREF1546_00761 [Oscillibacter sp. KLE 1745]